MAQKRCVSRTASACQQDSAHAEIFAASDIFHAVLEHD
jgi:hypothetical protein